MDSVLPADSHFEKEIKTITSLAIRDAVVFILNEITPRYFWTVQSSPTGLHHPPDERKEGGLVLHTKRVFWVARDLCRSFQLSVEDCDEILAAALIHDMFCRGLSEEAEPNTLTDHELIPEKTLYRYLYQPRYQFVKICKSHAGRWGPAPIMTLQQLILHLADLVASRPNITVDVENVLET